jgi:hypothetical protein
VAAHPASLKAGDPRTDDRQLDHRLQVLASEQWALVATRSMAWNESFSRVSMFLTVLSGTIVALAFVAQGTAFGHEFVLFGLVILPVVFFIGVATFIRIVRSNAYATQCVIGMNRIRHAYLEIAPEVAPYLVMGAYDDEVSLDQTMGARQPGAPWVDVLVSTPFVLSTVNSVVAGTVAALAAFQANAGAGLAVALALNVAGAVFVVQTLLASHRMTSEVRAYEPLFPSPASNGSGRGRTEITASVKALDGRGSVGG